MKRVLVLLFVLTAFAAAWTLSGGAKVVDETLSVEFATDTLGDTAAVLMFAPSAGIDSFLYKDTLFVNGLESTVVAASWTSPLQKRRVLVGLDTSINYVCTLDLGTHKYGFIYDPSGNDDTTVALLIDNLVDSFNNVAGMKDTVAAQDSISYVLLVGKKAQIQLEGDARWIGIFGDSLTEGESTFTTVAMVCDSMAAAINASDSAAKYGTGSNSGDTGFLYTSDDQGLDFFAALADTATDTSRVQANVTSVSAITDTFSVAEFNVGLADEMFRASGVVGWIILYPCSDTNQGFGDSDSGYIWLYSIEKVDSNLVYYILDQDSCNSLPCSCRVDIIDAAANDSLFHHSMGIGYRVMDTLTDTIINASYRMSVDFIITDGF